MRHAINHDIADRLDEVGHILAEQGAGRYRVQAYHQAASVLRGLIRPVDEIFETEGIEGLERLHGIGESIARSIRDLLRHGRLAMLDRLRGGHDPIALLTSVPGIGTKLAWRLHDELEIESLEELEAAAHDGRLENLPGLGAKKLAGIRDTLGQRLGRIHQAETKTQGYPEPSVSELLNVDENYLHAVAAGSLEKIAPRHLNPRREAWLPIMHTQLGNHDYTALFSNTPHAHRVGKTGDWVVIYCDRGPHEHRYTVITAEYGPLKDRRIVRGREDECLRHYRHGPATVKTLPPQSKSSRGHPRRLS